MKGKVTEAQDMGQRTANSSRAEGMQSTGVINLDSRERNGTVGLSCPKGKWGLNSLGWKGATQSF